MSSADVTGSLGFTPYNATNPSGYQTAAQVTAVLPVASSTAPLMDGAVAIGTGTTWARADHVHASDTSRAPTASPTFTGTVNVGTTAAGGGTILHVNAPTTQDCYLGFAGARSWAVGTQYSGADPGEFIIYDNTAAQYRLQIGSAGALTIGNTSSGGGTQMTINAPAAQDCYLEWVGARTWQLGPQAAGGNLGRFILYDTVAPRFGIIVGTDGSCQNTTGTWTAVSDRRVKRDVAVYERGLDAVLRLTPITFCYNGLGGTADDGTVQYGFEAEAVAEIMPELVGDFMTEEETFATVDPTRSIYAVINAIKELAAQNAALEARIAALEGARH
jgi:hypothetical protein